MNNNPKNWNLHKRGMLPSRDITIEEYNNMIEKIQERLRLVNNIDTIECKRVRWDEAIEINYDTYTKKIRFLDFFTGNSIDLKNLYREKEKKYQNIIFKVDELLMIKYDGEFINQEVEVFNECSKNFGFNIIEKREINSMI